MPEGESSHLPLIRSPFVHPGEQKYHHHPHHHHGDEESSPGRPKIERSDTISKPAFRRFTQASHSELFYDLFFVANLTTFTYVHEINDGDSFRQYIGFFCLLWFTWYQVSLYDVRFAMDSAFERVCKAVQLLVLIVFAVCGPKFNPGEESNDDTPDKPNLNYFQGMTIALMASRLVLVAQHLQALCFAREYKKSKMPIIFVALTYFVAAMIYLGLFWGLRVVDANGDNHTYWTWYGTAVLETIIITGISMRHRNLSFEGTHLVERMSLLTLIILGEGAIATAKACQYIAYSEGEFSFSGSVGASIFCAVLILYLLYMIYFDFQNEEYFGPIRTQIWSTLHFPLHLALVLAVEGISQSIMWNAASVRSKEFSFDIARLIPLFSNSSTGTAQDFADAATQPNATANTLISVQIERSTSFLSSQQGIAYLGQTIISASPAIANGTEDLTTARNAFWWLQGSEAVKNIEAGWTVFSLTYTYFFVSIGLVVILLALLAWLNRGRQAKSLWLRLTVTSLTGVTLALLATMILTDRVIDFVLGPWILPTVTLMLFGIVVANGIKLPGRNLKSYGNDSATNFRFWSMFSSLPPALSHSKRLRAKLCLFEYSISSHANPILRQQSDSWVVLALIRPQENKRPLAAAFVQTLGGASNITIFAPSNEALQAASQVLQSLNATPDAIAALLTYHVVNASVSSANITETPTFAHTLLSNETYTSLPEGQVVGVRKEGDNVVVISGAGARSNVTTADVAIANGSFVHIIDSVLTLPINVYLTAVAANLTALAGAINATNLTEPLIESEQITVFAPTTEAFDDISSALQDLSLEDATAILGYHVINGTVAYSSNLTNATLTSSGGQDLNITIIDGAVFVNAARVIAADVLIANGVVHVIDSVLNPNSTVGPDPSSAEPVVAFEGATDDGDVPYTSGIPAATGTPLPTNPDVAAGYTPPSEGVTSASSEGSAPRATGAVAAAVLFGAAGFAANL
ncbi:Uncharacterized protein BST61_g8209 [Cercospora zeina]